MYELTTGYRQGMSPIYLRGCDSLTNSAPYRIMIMQGGGMASPGMIERVLFSILEPWEHAFSPVCWNLVCNVGVLGMALPIYLPP